MADSNTLIERAYAAFNERNVDGALAFMSDKKRRRQAWK
jgi:DNA-binding transcriptional regulator YbjK